MDYFGDTVGHVEKRFRDCGIDEREGEIIYRTVDSETKRETDEERVIAVEEGPVRMEFFHRHVTDRYRKYWPAPVDVVQKMVQDIVDVATEMDKRTGTVGLGVQSGPIQGVLHDAMWRAMVKSIREPERFFKCSSA